jgi:hypothetical protein
MHRARCIVLLVLLAALPALAVAQDAPLTPRVIGADEATILRTWGEPSSRYGGAHPEVGRYVAWHYEALPWPEGDPSGARTLSILLQERHVIGAAVFGTSLEHLALAEQRVKRRAEWMREHWGTPEAAFRGFVRWVDDESQWLVAYLSRTSHEEIPEGKAQFASVVGVVPIAAMLYDGAFN